MRSGPCQTVPKRNNCNKGALSGDVGLRHARCISRSADGWGRLSVTQRAERPAKGGGKEQAQKGGKKGKP